MNQTEIDDLLAQARRITSSQSAQALALADQAREASRALAYKQGEAAALVVHASALYMFGRGNEALNDLTSALEIGEKNEIGCTRGAALQMIARVYYTQGQYERASDCWLACLELPDSAVAPEFRTRAHVGLGQLLFAHEQYETALAHHRRAADLAEEQDDPHLVSICLINIAVDLMRLNRFEESHATLKQALPLVRAGQNLEYEAEIYSVVGQIHLARGELDRARMSLMVALKINRLHINTWGEASSLLWLGRSSMGSGYYESAQDELRRALALAEAMGSQHLMAQAHRALAELYARCEDHDAAVRHETEFQTLRNQLLQQAYASPQLATMELRLNEH
ncbi:tetratricopeptide repeat protein [Amantichitinum ursilacus]|uniref:Tetratricopeptide repeat protein n=1 Tax=Amantichitinum ursilacus TaxID=857265 RepID=A0A0N0GKT6_9NEIS|nr:tetratricopeptide repeat protein [Amantichitinum ursilacus]KPC49154.1 Tetratricopeptide repeat protein [Amantichitinum ursilacus]